ncbi:DUF5319 family protein [Blastococcus sp. TML/C7B]|uniref:DUF5319 family protein n=1 Tax=Blastococcus sp. TML/C7B TaxID=2798728 RepID=UPI00281532BD|nr:DUF5319 family protein [Blastococcus sp. TML/C7B]
MSAFDDGSGLDFGAHDPDFGPGSQGPPPLTIEERAGVLDDLAELEVFRTLLEPTGVKGIVVDCPDCDEEHHVDWALMQANLRQLLDEGQTGRHEPPFDPDPDDYVSWDYASGYADGVAAAAERDEPTPAATARAGTRTTELPPRLRGSRPPGARVEASFPAVGSEGRRRRCNHDQHALRAPSRHGKGPSARVDRASS